MRTLIHSTFDGPSRTVRLALAEKGLPARLLPTDEAEDFAVFNPAMTTPVLLEETPTGEPAAIAPAAVICDYLEEAYAGHPLLPNASGPRAEARRLAAWFHETFDEDVATPIARPTFGPRRPPPPFAPELCAPEPCAAERPALDGSAALRWHLDYVNWLLERRSWLAGERLSIADLAAAAHLSVCDYLGALPWRDFPAAYEWYARIKSRPAMRALLEDRFPGVPPARHYRDPDF